MTNYKAIDGFPGYRVGDDGTVWTCRIVLGGRKPSVVGNVWRKLSPGAGRCGHQHVSLSRDSTPHQRKVHRLVLEAFVGPCPPGMEGCHNNGDGTDNRISNLRWDTHKANIADRSKHGNTTRGSDHWCASGITPEQANVIRKRRAQGETLSALALAHKVGISTIHRICTFQGRWSK